MDTHLLDLGVGLAVAAFAGAVTWLANCVSKSTKKNQEVHDKVLSLEFTMREVIKDLEKLQKVTEQVCFQTKRGVL
jgi:hypothetical protein